MHENDTDSANTENPEETTGTRATPVRRRAASRPAGPPPEIDDTPPVIVPPEPAPPQAAVPQPGTGETEEQAAADQTEEQAEEQQVAGQTADQAAEKAAERAEEQAIADQAGGPAGAADEQAASAEAQAASADEQPTSADEQAGSAEAQAGPPAEEPAPAKKPARAARATRSRSRKTAPPAEPEAAETTATSEVKAAEAAEPAKAPETAEAPAAEAKPARSRSRRRTAETAPPPVPEVPAIPEIPAVPTLDVSAEPETPGIPSVTFQPPMVVFQPPQPAPRAEAPARHAAAVVGEDEEDIEPVDLDEEDEEGGDRPRRRRRRGGRGRGKTAEKGRETEAEDEAEEDAPEAQAEPAEETRTTRSRRQRKTDKADKTDKTDKVEAAETAEGEETAGPAQEAEDTDEDAGTSRRRRRRRRRSGTAEGDEQAPDDPPHTVVHVRPSRTAEPRDVTDEVQSVKGSTRLEAKKQRRREGREQGRRRPPVITESEFLARRESVERVMVIRQHGERTQIAVLEDNVLVEHYVDRATHQSYVGNVYLGKVQNVLPSMEAAFVDVGKGRNAVLYAGEVNWDVAGLVGQPRRIESALKSGQSVLVQVTKDPIGHKGARLTSQVSLPGRYLVYVPDGSMTGISRKLPDKERSRLKQVLKKIMPDNAGVIVRTAAEGATEEELEGDVSRLAAQWEHIQRQAKTANAPALLHGEPDLTIRVVRDIFNEDFSKLVVSGDDAWDMVSEYVRYVAPHLADRVERWDGDTDVLASYRIDEQIAKALERKVWLPSGGSLVIDRTEAMTVVDVNTGKFTGQGGNLEETVTRNNLEAAEEIVRQLRLRDVGGIIVIDFIDMVLESNRELVLRRLLECLSRDRTKHQVAEVTSLGLVQMTRKRVGQGLLEAFSEVCECCNGRGIHVQTTPVEHTPDKAASGSRRRKRKGEVEKAVEEKLAKQESAKQESAKRATAKREQGPPPELDEPAPQTAEETTKAAEAPEATVEATETAPAVEPEPADRSAEPEETAPASNGRRRTRRSRAKKAEVAETAAAES
ncbi:ribonuclease E [Thermomonospora echinospora]|uniref:Ribonuclease E n=1 Tax=Thermomonospora echinospora TaxID=1992 RepID=A0A1H6DNU4_9ACTN|nr:Rne/Rng family ribonuclease [Thermomonospora echinospora]SEG86841.1 ribonuclease E [Thermomonospora echinospora]